MNGCMLIEAASDLVEMSPWYDIQRAAGLALSFRPSTIVVAGCGYPKLISTKVAWTAPNTSQRRQAY